MLASIQRIKEVKNHPNADLLEIVQVMGWTVVVQGGQFKVGDLCVYVQIDTVVPNKPEFAFLEQHKFRVRTIKLRGIVSQGICFDMDQIFGGSTTDDYKEGDDVTDVIGVTKYEKPIPMCLTGKALGGFPTHILSKTDEERIQNVPELLDEIKEDTVINITKKHDGTSATFLIDPLEKRFRVCSRNLELAETPESTLWKIARELKLEEKFHSFNMGGQPYVRDQHVPLAIQGEVIGEGIQKNPEDLRGQHFRAFNLSRLDWMSSDGACSMIDQNEILYTDGRLPFEEFCSICRTFDIPQVEVVGSCTRKKMCDTLGFEWSIDGLLELADHIIYNSGTPVEGIVVRTNVPIYTETLGKALSFKVISNKYLLKNKE